MHVHSEVCVHSGHFIPPLTQTSFFVFLSVSFWRLLTNTCGEDKQTDPTPLCSICAANPPRERRKSSPFPRLFEQFFAVFSRVNTWYLGQTSMFTKSSVSLFKSFFLLQVSGLWELRHITAASNINFGFSNEGVVGRKKKVSVRLVKEKLLCFHSTPLIWSHHGEDIYILEKKKTCRHF